MARNRNNRNNAPVESVAPAQQDVGTEIATVESSGAIPKVAPLAQAKAINFARTLVDSADNAVAAGVVKTAKGTNVSKARVYGYDNGTQGGKVPVGATIVVVPGARPPAGVTPDQWLLLQQYAGKSVTVAYDNKVTSRSVRRAYRAGAIRFLGA
jgi:hypothetical protein